MTNDSAAYLGAAQGLADGHGLTSPYRPNSEPVPDHATTDGRTTLTAFPPLFPVAVASVSKLAGSSVFDAARWLNALAFALSAALAFAAVRRRTRSEGWGLLAAGLLMANDLVLTYAMGWSEPLFILLTLATVVVLDRYLTDRYPTDRGDLKALLGVCGLVALGVLTRQVGVANGATAALAMILVVRGDRRRRWGGAAAVAAAVALPTIGWTLLNPELRAGHSATSLAWHPVTLHDARTLGGTLADWFVSVDVVGAALAGVVMLAVLAALLWLCRSSPATREDVATHLPLVAALYAGVYLAAVVLADTFVGVGTIGFGTRILAPVHAVTIVGIAVYVGRAVARDDTRRRLAYGLVGALVVAGLLRTGLLVGHFDDSVDKGLTRAEMLRSPTLAELRDLPADTVIITDSASQVWVATGRSSIALPPETVFATGEVNQDRDEQLRQIADAVDGRPAVLVLLDSDPSVVDQPYGRRLVLGLPTEHDDGQIFPVTVEG